MSNNRSSGQSEDELHERAVQALVREWKVTEQEARDAIERARERERRLGNEVAHEQAWREEPWTA